MTKPRKIEYPGKYYHVMNRGNRGEDIFLNDKTRHAFLDDLADCCETYRIKLIAYVLICLPLERCSPWRARHPIILTMPKYLVCFDLSMARSSSTVEAPIRL